MKPAERRIWLGILLVIGTLSTLARAENLIEMTTYISVPGGRLHANRGTIGPPYRPELLPDASVPAGALLVSGNAGVGTASPRSNPPNGIPTGNLDANDVFLRGNNLWASQLAGAMMMMSGENSSGINVSPSGSSLVRLTAATFGRPLVVLGKVWGNFRGNGVLRLYRDGVLMDEARWNTPDSGTLPNSGVVMKAETTLAAGNHVFDLTISATSGTVGPGGAKLTVMEI